MFLNWWLTTQKEGQNLLFASQLHKKFSSKRKIRGGRGVKIHIFFKKVHLQTQPVGSSWVKLLRFGWPALERCLLVKGSNCLLPLFPRWRVFPIHVTSLSHGKLPPSPSLNIKLWVKSQPLPPQQLLLLLLLHEVLCWCRCHGNHTPNFLFSTFALTLEKKPRGRRQHMEGLYNSVPYNQWVTAGRRALIRMGFFF